MFFAAKASAILDSTLETSVLDSNKSCSSCFMRASYDLLNSLCQRTILTGEKKENKKQAGVYQEQYKTLILVDMVETILGARGRESPLPEDLYKNIFQQKSFLKKGKKIKRRERERERDRRTINTTKALLLKLNLDKEYIDSWKLRGEIFV